MFRVLQYLCLLATALAVPVREDTCGYKSCPHLDPDVLNVHIVPHTHDDVGWLKTLDQYYYGSRNNIQKAGVEYILDSVVKELWEDKNRRFIYVETAFFWKWWTQQSEQTKDIVHTLVREGRLEFIGGAWSMNDEAATHYQSTIDQFTFGLKKLNDTFGECGRPRIGWQIDPFGHAREFASNLAAMQYDGLFLGRIDYQDKSNRLSKKTMEMVWRGDDNLGKSSDIFTSVLYNHYSPPRGFCFDVLCDDEPIVDDASSPMYNVDARIADFLKFSYEQSGYYRTSNIIVTMGGDFTYQDARMWYKNLDKLIKYTNLKAAKEGIKIKLFYSTPSCYLKAVKEANPTLPTKQDDFFPYASDSTAYWTGYFTSRPTTKFFERQGNRHLQIAKQMQVLANLDKDNDLVLDELRAAMGVMQHHDAITGTEKQHVTHDYERILTKAIDDNLVITKQAFHKLSGGNAMDLPELSYSRCQLNQSQCEVSENSDAFILTVYNAASWIVSPPVEVPVVGVNYVVYAPDGAEIKTQFEKLSDQILKMNTRKSRATHSMTFIAKNLPAVGFKQYYVKKQNKVRRDTPDVDLEGIEKVNKHANEFYASINDYWKLIKEQPYIDIKNLETVDSMYKKPILDLNDNVNGNPTSKLIMPDERINVMQKKYVNTDNEKYYEAGLEILKDNKDGEINEDIIELEKIIREARKQSELEDNAKVREETKQRVKYPVLNEDEMRMLADDPMIVEKYEDIILENEDYKLVLNQTTGEIKEVILSDGSKPQFSFKIGYYRGCEGDNREPANRSSGAYIFRPNGTMFETLKSRVRKIIKGPVYDSVTYDNEFGRFGIKLYKDSTSRGLTLFFAMSIDITDGFGKEIVFQYEMHLNTNEEFYTDSNGRQMLKRKINSRPQYNVTLLEPVPGNYYPVTNRIAVTDGKIRMSILTDRAVGGGSLKTGEVEVMVHRRLLRDDAFGVGEALNETTDGQPLIVVGHQYLLMQDESKKNMIDEKRDVIEMHLTPEVFASDAKSLDYDKWLGIKNEYSGLKNQLPDGVHILTLEPWRNGELLFRLENYFDKDDKDNTNVEVDVSNLFVGLKLINIKETNLAANQWLKDSMTWEWNTENEFSQSFNNEYGNSSPVETAVDKDLPKDIVDFKIELAAKQIRTFVVDYEFVNEM